MPGMRHFEPTSDLAAGRLREAGITSQEALAAKAGVHRTYVGRLERGESGITVEALAAILAVLDVSLGDANRA